MEVSTIKGWYKEYVRTCETVAKFLVRKIKVKPNSKIVELGCGGGAFTIPLASKLKGYQIIAIDKDGKALEELKSNVKRFALNNVIVVESNARKLNKIEDNSVDFVLSHWLLGVITKHEDIRQIIKESYRILKKGGIAAHSESYPIPTNKAQWLYMKTDMLAFHTRWWDPNKIKKIMRKVRFRKISTELIDFKIRISPKISIPLIREWQRREYSFTKKKSVIENARLESFLNIHRNDIERYGLEFPTEYVTMGVK